MENINKYKIADRLSFLKSEWGLPAFPPEIRFGKDRKEIVDLIVANGYADSDTATKAVRDGFSGISIMWVKKHLHNFGGSTIVIASIDHLRYSRRKNGGYVPEYFLVPKDTPELMSEKQFIYARNEKWKADEIFNQWFKIVSNNITSNDRTKFKDGINELVRVTNEMQKAFNSKQ